MQDLDGKVAVVTGGASGIGLAMARRFADAGMRVMLADVDEPGLEAALATLGDVEATSHVTDVTQTEAVQGLCDATLERYGAVHLVCNNAGVGGHGGASWELSDDAWRWAVDVNLWGVVNGVRAFLPALVEQDEGHVVNTASMAGLIALPYAAPYTAAKHAVVGMTEALYHELRMRGSRVGVSVLCPAWVRTAIADRDRSRPGEPDEPASDDPIVAQMDAFIEQVVSTGMDPDDVAAQVLDAITADRFWILTHPHDAKAAHRRIERALAGENPVFGPGAPA